MPGGFRELLIVRKLMMLYVLITSEALMNISLFLMVMRQLLMVIGKKVQAMTYLRLLKNL